MTEEAQEPFYRQYWASQKAVAAYGLSEDFDDESNVAEAPNSSASWAANVPVVRLSEVHAQAVSQDYPRFIRMTAGTGKTYIFVRYARESIKSFGKLPTTLVTSGAAATAIASGQAGSMATQQPPTTDDESVEEIIWRAGTTLSTRHRVKLAARLSELQKAVQEELDGRGITANSLQHFIKLLRAYPALRYPAISVTPERNIYASWKSKSDRVFSVHFLPDGNVRFIIFCPNEKHAGETIRLSGVATSDVVMSVGEPHGILKWATE